MCTQQYRSIVIAQPNRRSSLRDLVINFMPHQDKLYHLGISARVSRSTVPKAEKRRVDTIFISVPDMPRQSNYPLLPVHRCPAKRPDLFQVH